MRHHDDDHWGRPGMIVNVVAATAGVAVGLYLGFSGRGYGFAIAVVAAMLCAVFVVKLRLR